VCTSRIAQFLFAVLGATAVQRGPLWWIYQHRHHHKHSDEEEDVHSPTLRDFWWSHIGWITSGRNFPTDYSQVRDLAKFPELVFLNRFACAVCFHSNAVHARIHSRHIFSIAWRHLLTVTRLGIFRQHHGFISRHVVHQFAGAPARQTPLGERGYPVLLFRSTTWVIVERSFSYCSCARKKSGTVKTESWFVQMTKPVLFVSSVLKFQFARSIEFSSEYTRLFPPVSVT
jgi:hypothetical protein